MLKRRGCQNAFIAKRGSYRFASMLQKELTFHEYTVEVFTVFPETFRYELKI